MCALNGEVVEFSGIEQVYIGLVTMASHIIVAVYLTSLDVYLDVGPFVEGLGHRLGVGDVENVVESILRAIYDVQSLFQAFAGFCTCDKVVVYTALHVEGSIFGNVAVYEYEERVKALGIDTRGVTHVRATSTHEFLIPIFSVAVGVVAVYAEVFFVGGPVVVLEFQGNVYHERGHSSLGKCFCKVFVAHSQILGLELSTCSVLEVGFSEIIYDSSVVVTLRENILKPSYDGAVFCPTA